MVSTWTVNVQVKLKTPDGRISPVPAGSVTVKLNSRSVDVGSDGIARFTDVQGVIETGDKWYPKSYTLQAVHKETGASVSATLILDSQIPESGISRYTVCGTCGGDGKITSTTTCGLCGGYGYITTTKTETCPTCGGSGVVVVSSEPCPYCYGRGTMAVCTSCGATLYWAQTSRGCPYCGGSRFIDFGVCDKCGGVGIVKVTETCPDCGGSGKVTITTTETCPVCGGSGLVTSSYTCPTCGGSGQVLRSFPYSEYERTWKVV